MAIGFNFLKLMLFRASYRDRVYQIKNDGTSNINLTLETCMFFFFFGCGTKLEKPTHTTFKLHHFYNGEGYASNSLPKSRETTLNAWADKQVNVGVCWQQSICHTTNTDEQTDSGRIWISAVWLCSVIQLQKQQARHEAHTRWIYPYKKTKRELKLLKKYMYANDDC